MRFQEKFPKSSEMSLRLQGLFDSSSIEELAYESKFVQKPSPMTGFKFFKLCLEGVAKDGQLRSLNELCVSALKMNSKLSEQSLNERFNKKGVAFMKVLFEKVVEQRLDNSALNLLTNFSQINLGDSTQIALAKNLASLYTGSGGNASKAQLKIDFTYDLKSDCFDLNLRDGKRADVSMQLPDKIAPNSLWLKDMGYFKLANFERIEKKEAYYISRLKAGVLVYLSAEKEAEPIDFLKVLKKMKCNEVKDFKVFIGKHKRLPSRLILQKVPKEVANKKRKARKKAKVKRGAKVSKYRFALCDGNAFITNLEKEEWTGYEVMTLYKIRWQIEILFKVWKSILKIDKMKKIKPERFLCLMYAQLIWVVLNMRVFQSFKISIWKDFQIEISELKSYKIIKSFHRKLLKAIFRNTKKSYKKCLDRMYESILLFGKKKYRRGNPNPLFTWKKTLT